MLLDEFLSEWNNSDDKILVHTSGSTGKPKPMWAEKQKMLNSARITCDFLGLKAGDTALLCMPLDYIAGKMVVVRSIERHLRLITVTPSNHPLAGLSEAPVFAAMVPSQVFCSLQVPEERDLLLQIKHLIIGGGAITKELQECINTYHQHPRATGRLGDAPITQGQRVGLEMHPQIWSTYGMTETLSHIALRRLDGPDASEWYTPFDSVSLSLNDDGCLVIDAPLVHDGLLVTNDIAELRPDGRFRIIGRKDNVICSGGIKLQIEKIEDKLRPYISQPFCITKRPDEKFGEVAVLLVESHGELSPHPSSLTPHPSSLTRFETPKAIIHVESIPMTATGKIDRARALLLAKHPDNG